MSPLVKEGTQDAVDEAAAILGDGGLVVEVCPCDDAVCNRQHLCVLLSRSEAVRPSDHYGMLCAAAIGGHHLISP